MSNGSKKEPKKKPTIDERIVALEQQAEQTKETYLRIQGALEMLHGLKSEEEGKEKKND
tara:strand:+ start:285 stop:461 length:177 start_codon:yes stop_codon:yes gene_type:complete